MTVKTEKNLLIKFTIKDVRDKPLLRALSSNLSDNQMVNHRPDDWAEGGRREGGRGCSPRVH